MKKQTEITTETPLLDEKGRALKPGYCKRNLYIYNKDVIRNKRRRIKEWDFYLITDGRIKIELNFFNISFAAALTAEVVDLKTGRSWSDMILEPSGPDKYTLSPAADADFLFHYRNAGRSAWFKTEGTRHSLVFRGKSKGKRFEINIKGDRLPGQESLTVLTPFKDPAQFFYSQKLNCIACTGTVRIGDTVLTLNPDRAFMTVDWARGVWPYASSWYWTNGSTYLNGKRFGFELTWGFGNESHATETALFYDGKCHKIGPVKLDSDPAKEGWLSPWHFTDAEGRLDLTLTPVLHRPVGLVFAGIAGHKSDQVFGHFNGRVRLDDGTVLEIKDMFAFAEKAVNRW